MRDFQNLRFKKSGWWDDGKKYRQFHLHHHHHSRGEGGEKEKADRERMGERRHKTKKTAAKSRTLERLTLMTSSETADVTTAFASPMVASSPMMILGVIIDVDYSNSEVKTRVSRVSL